MLNSIYVLASISLPESNCQVAPSVGGMLFALPVGGVNIWPIGRGIPWGNMLASCHIMAQTTDWVVYLVCRSFSPTQRNYAWALALLSSHRM